MNEAYLLINVEVGTDKDVLKAIEKIRGVKDAKRVYGIYDIIARVEEDRVLVDRIRQLDNITSTITMLTVPE